MIRFGPSIAADAFGTIACDQLEIYFQPRVFHDFIDRRPGVFVGRKPN
jgi:hypothetical protein